MKVHILLSPMQARLADGAGVIGNHLVEALFADRHTVTILDNFCTGHRAPLAAPLDAPSLRVVQADVNGLSGIPPRFQGNAWVLHLAAPVQPLAA
jgi:UDP-glucose 4-epimerase